MSDISKEELKAHLSTVEAQMRASLRVSASESKLLQQAHNALRADLSTTLIRNQSDANLNYEKLSSKLDKLLSEVDSLAKQRKFITFIMVAILLFFGVLFGILLAIILFNFDVSIYENIFSILDMVKDHNKIN